ncbi:MAG: (2Fe-2S)-binding protein [Planctomycetaceae bacterium]|jgi:NADH dehydrogenase/NADH:ubiquinone oxidoreductase subunit G|nr:(2Fe-2S)-binding protein [Planctomycetaceae bacterium]
MQVILDGNPVSAHPGEMIFDTAQRAGIDIPALCRFPGLKPPSTSCLVCLVKQNGKFVPSCATPVEEGMVIESETDEVHVMRRSALELLLSDHISHCRTCGEGRKKCRLLKYIGKYKIDRRRFGLSDMPEHILQSDRVVFDARKCIKCGICVAICRQHSEKVGLTLFGRGFNTHIGVPFDEPLQKGIEQSAESIVPACPTAALTWRE